MYSVIIFALIFKVSAYVVCVYVYTNVYMCAYE